MPILHAKERDVRSSPHQSALHVVVLGEFIHHPILSTVPLVGRDGCHSRTADDQRFPRAAKLAQLCLTCGICPRNPVGCVACCRHGDALDFENRTHRRAYALCFAPAISVVATGRSAFAPIAPVVTAALGRVSIAGPMPIAVARGRDCTVYARAGCLATLNLGIRKDAICGLPAAAALASPSSATGWLAGWRLTFHEDARACLAGQTAALAVPRAERVAADGLHAVSGRALSAVLAGGP